MVYGVFHLFLCSLGSVLLGVTLVFHSSLHPLHFPGQLRRHGPWSGAIRALVRQFTHLCPNSLGSPAFTSVLAAFLSLSHCATCHVAPCDLTCRTMRHYSLHSASAYRARLVAGTRFMGSTGPRFLVHILLSGFYLLTAPLVAQ